MSRLPARPLGIERWHRTASLTGAVALVALAGAWFWSPHDLFRSYLFAYLFWLGITLGSLALLMLQHLVGGGWGLVIRRILEASVSVLPWMALLFLPLLVGMEELYEWARPAAVAADPLLAHKQPYLNPFFFVVRALLYFVVWVVLGQILIRLSDRQDEGHDASLTRKLQLLSGPGLVLYGATVTFASIDWGMSLEPHWFSTIYGLIFMVGQGLSALALATLVLALIHAYRPRVSVASSHHFHDLGNLTLAFVMIWAYIGFSQYLITWSGNLPEEIPWYLRRARGGWEMVAAGLVLLHFAIPFVLLLSRRMKRYPQRAGVIAGGLLLLRVVDLFWLIVPGTGHEVGLRVVWTDLAALAGIGGVWVALFCRHLSRRPLLPPNDPRTVELAALEEEAGHA